MQFKTMVMIVRDKADGERVMNAIAPIVADSNCHLIAVHAETSALAYMPAVGAEAAAYDSGVIAANREHMDALRDWFNEECKRQLITGEWRGYETFSGDSATSAIASGRAADMIVTQQADPDVPADRTTNLESLLFESGRPVLAIPYTQKGPLKLERAMIAWKESREATRAVFDALPLLQIAKKVEILCVDGEDSAEMSASMAATEIAGALARHGVEVTVENRKSAGIPVSAVIENRLAETGADLLVMGAYSRAPLAERLFGGVTRTVLGSMPVPTLMSR